MPVAIFYCGSLLPQMTVVKTRADSCTCEPGNSARGVELQWSKNVRASVLCEDNDLGHRAVIVISAHGPRLGTFVVVLGSYPSRERVASYTNPKRQRGIRRLAPSLTLRVGMTDPAAFPNLGP